MASNSVRAMPLFYLFFLFIAFLPGRVAALASTDTITWGGDNTRAGYQNNHNMDPAVVGSAQFGLLFRTQLPGNYQGYSEQMYSQTLVYTLSDGIQYLFVATTQNNVYKINAKTGVIIASRNLARPFLQSDLGNCNDINPHIGVTATGVIDPDTDTWYLTSKTYADQSLTGATGRPNGRYYIHAINCNDLSEQPNFPIDLEGMVALNNPVRIFNGGIHHQRPALLHYGQYVYAGFASHCIQYNYTGWIVGWDKTSGALVEQMATEGAGVSNTVPGAGVWMSGGGIASDGQGSMWFASGNGYASQLNGIPLSGHQPPTSLEEAAVHATINSDGSLQIVDFFMPFEKVQLDGADKDLGTTPLEILPSQYSCGDNGRIGVVTGKSGKTYWLDLDDLGGYQNGPNKGDAAIQVYQNENSVYAGAGVYPLEGGYIYISVIAYQTHVFKFSCTNGVPSFTKVADTPEFNAGALGTGHGTVTSLNDQPGSGLVWVSDVEGLNLRIYNAVPVNGNLTLINSFNTPGTTKFTRPVFGDGIAYQGTTQGYLYAYGSPVNLPMNCSSLNFGTISLNSTSLPLTVQCQANTALQVTALTLTGNPNFVISGLPVLPLSVAAGSNFSFLASFAPQSVGPLSSSVIVNTTQAVSGYSINTPIQLKGVAQSQAPLLKITPNTVSFSGVITGQQPAGVNQTVIFNNLGNANAVITNVQYSTVSETGPWISANSSASGASIGPFTFIALPVSIPGNGESTVTINFNPLTSGNYAAFVLVSSNGGSALFDVVGQGGDYPVAKIEFQTPDGNGWVPYNNNSYFTFGNVTENTSLYLKMRVSNVGSSNAAGLSLTVSKPPFGDAGLIGAANNVDLAEGTILYAGENATASLFCSVPKAQINSPSYNGTANWTMNLGDPNFGLQHIEFFCEATTPQYNNLGAQLNGTGQYEYVGCFQDNINNVRQLQINIYSNSSNTNEMCIAACSAQGYIFAGTEFQQECWCGNYRPRQVVADANCNYGCAGNVGETCGGQGVGGGLSMLSVFADSTRFDGNTTEDVGPYVNPGVLGFTSQGCWIDSGNPRALPIRMTPANQTVAMCLQACQGYQYAGVEYGGECYCGNSLVSGSNTPITDCDMSCNGNGTEYCGAGNRLNLYSFGNSTISTSSISTTSTQSSNLSISATSLTATASATSTGPAIVKTAGAYSFVDCHTDSTASRALTGPGAQGSMMTVEYCANVCTGTTYMGIEYGRECYCGNTLSNGSVTATDGRCNMACAANSLEICGGSNGLSLYQLSSNFSSSITSSTIVLSSTLVPVLNSSSVFMTSSLSSLTTVVTVNTTSTSTPTSALNTSSVPMASSLSSSTTAATVNTTPSFTTASTAISITSSNLISSTSAAPSPTGPSVVQSVGSFAYVDCHTDNNLGARALPQWSTTSDSMTVALCASYCSGYTFFGLEYSSECYCSNRLANTSSTATDGRCNMVCSGNSFEICGGSKGLTLYQYANGSTSSSSPTSVSMSSATTMQTLVSSSTNSASVLSSTSVVLSSTASTSSASSSAITSTPSNASNTISSATAPSSTSASTSASSATPTWTYTGCVTDNGKRVLTGPSTTSPNMTPSLCQSFCLSAEHSLAGLEYSSQCYCGDSLVSNTSSTACDMSCSGNSSQTCGGPYALSLYGYTGYVPPLQTTPQIGSYAYQGCWTDNVQGTGRSLKAYSFTNTTGMTEELCIGTCQAKGYAWAGVEYSQECYCDSSLAPASSKVNDTQCSMLCTGNNKEYCGAGNLLSVYKSS